MTVKPIVLIRIPFVTSDVLDELKNNHQILNLKLEYHVLFLCTHNLEVIFEVFYEKDFTNVKFEELKEIITKTINE